MTFSISDVLGMGPLGPTMLRQPVVTFGSKSPVPSMWPVAWGGDLDAHQLAAFQHVSRHLMARRAGWEWPLLYSCVDHPPMTPELIADAEQAVARGEGLEWCPGPAAPRGR